MLIGISDIHLQDTTLSGTPDDENVPAEAFALFFQHVAASARHNRAREITFLLNGDIFDFLRTERWFVDGFTGRPYDHPFSPEVEAKLVEVWEGIRQSNAETLALLSDVAYGRDRFDFPVRPRFVYVAGNHDRLVNVSPALRRKVHELLNLEHADEPLGWTFAAPEYGVFARHGHEYDWTNSEYNFTYRRNGAALDERLYWETPLGDWVTLDLATYLPYRFRQLYGDHPLFARLYPRLRSIDDVRPASNAVPWLRNEVADTNEAYNLLADTIRTVCREKMDYPFIWSWLKAHSRPYRPDRTHWWNLAVKVVPAALRYAPRPLVWRIAHTLLKGAGTTDAWSQAAREGILRDPAYQYIVSGHFHVPRTVLLRKTAGRPYVYFCIGSWRNRFEACRLDSHFLRFRSINYVTFFRRDEDPDRQGRPKTSSFSLWGGIAMRSDSGEERPPMLDF